MNAYSIKSIHFGIIFTTGPVYSERKKYKKEATSMKGLGFSPKSELFVKVGSINFLRLI